MKMAVTEKKTSPRKSAAKPKTAAMTKSSNVAGTKSKTIDKNVAAANVPGGKTQHKVKAEMNNFKDKATDTARSAAERGKERATEAVSGIGKLIRDSAQSIDDSVGKSYGDYARSAADAVDNFAGKMDTKHVDDIVGDARDFVRKSPGVAIGAAAAIGFVLSRLIRSGRDDA
jgi:ElaB/YqjD/DUF883 family membrane-anchored ribosome-binding protein